MHRKLIAAGSAVLIAEPVLALAHMGGIGAIVGLAIGAAAYCAVDELEQSRGGETTSPPNGKAPEKVVKPEKPSLAYRIFNGRSTRADAAEQTDQKQNQAEPEEPDIDGNIDALFHAQSEAEQDIGIPRLVVNDIVRHTQPDSYQVCIGRSLTRRGNPPVFINFYGQHLKLRGSHGRALQPE